MKILDAIQKNAYQDANSDNALAMRAFEYGVVLSSALLLGLVVGRILY